MLFSLNFNIFNKSKIRIYETSVNRVTKEYQEDIVNNKLAVSIKGTGFESEDKVYVNNQEMKTIMKNDTDLSFLIEKDIYLSGKKLNVDVRRLTQNGNIFIKSNTKSIDIIESNEVKDNKLKIEQVTPSTFNGNRTAISIIGNGFSIDSKIYIDNKVQETSYGDENLITCLIPEYYSVNSNIILQIKKTNFVNNRKEIYVSEIIKLNIKNGYNN